MSIDYSTNIGKLRLLIHDTDENNFEYTDEQIQCFLDMSYDNIVLGAILALESLVAKYSSIDGQKYRVDTIEFEESKSRSQHFLSLLNSLKEGIKDGTNPVIVGKPVTFGIYECTRRENEDRINRGELVPPRTSNDEYDLIKLNPQYGVYYQG